MKYKILHSHFAAALERLVGESILQGWEPIGGIAISEMRGFAQAMVLKPTK